jgi:hypothetical protein
LLLFLASVIPGLSLLLFSFIYLGYFIHELLNDPSGLLIPMLYGLALGFLWLIWMHILLILIRLLVKSRKKE